MGAGPLTYPGAGTRLGSIKVPVHGPAAEAPRPVKLPPVPALGPAAAPPSWPQAQIKDSEVEGDEDLVSSSGSSRKTGNSGKTDQQRSSRQHRQQVLAGCSGLASVQDPERTDVNPTPQT